MIKKNQLRFTLLVLLCFFFISLSASIKSASDEGMWTFDNPPTKQLQEKYGFTPTQEWLDHISGVVSDKGQANEPLQTE